MGALRDYFAAMGRTVLTLGDGLAVTGSLFFRRPTTIQYPDRTTKPVVATLPERSRGLLEVNLAVCTGCALCEKTCPIGCIKIEVTKGKERILQRYDIDLSKCMHCGLCVECCPTFGLRHTHEFEGSMYRSDLLLVHFVERPVPVAKPAKKGEPVSTPPALGSILRRLLPDARGKLDARQTQANQQALAALDESAAKRAAEAPAADTTPVKGEKA